MQFTLSNLQTSLSGYDGLPLETWNPVTGTAGVKIGSTTTFGNTYTTPVIDINGDSTDGRNYRTSFTADGSPVSIGDPSDLVVNDYGNPGDLLTAATVTIQNLKDGTAETLAATTTGTSITASYANGVLSLSGTGTLAQYQQVLRASPTMTRRACRISLPARLHLRRRTER